MPILPPVLSRAAAENLPGKDSDLHTPFSKQQVRQFSGGRISANARDLELTERTSSYLRSLKIFSSARMQQNLAVDYSQKKAFDLPIFTQSRL